jgi:hypothetical protein
MSQQGGPNIIMIALMGGAAYLAWSWYQAQQQQASASAATAQPAVPVTPPGVYAPPTTQEQLQAAAASNAIVVAQGGEADAYQWSTLWNQIGKTAIPNVNAIFFPNGLPTNAAAVTESGGKASEQGLPLMPLATFLAALQANNIGLGQTGKMIAVPVILAGKPTTMQLPWGTTPAMLQSMIRSRQA